MMKYLLVIVMWFFANAAFAEETLPIALEKAHVNIHDTASIKRGARFFAANCMVCHSMVYLRYNKLAQTTGVIYEKMPLKVTSWPFDVTPPDLSLEASHRGADWIYTYLHSFYADPARPTGVNNLLVPNTAMSGVLTGYQGVQVYVGSAALELKKYVHGYQWYDLVTLQAQGSMSPEQFDATITDVVNFLQYAAQPYQVEQERIGWGVLIFLLILFILVYLLKHEYWKELEKPKK